MTETDYRVTSLFATCQACGHSNEFDEFRNRLWHKRSCRECGSTDVYITAEYRIPNDSIDHIGDFFQIEPIPANDPARVTLQAETNGETVKR